MNENSTLRVGPTQDPATQSDLAPTPRFVAPATLARNAGYILVGETWSALVLMIAIPILVSAMGDSAFGLFSIAWVIIGYLLFLDVGISRGTTKFVSQYLVASRFEDAKDTIRTGFVAVFAIGSIGGLLVCCIIPLAIHVLKVAPALRHGAQVALFAVAICIPILLIQSLLRAVLSSLQEFGWIALINSCAMTLQWLVAAIVARRGAGVGAVVVSTVSVRLAATIVFALILWWSRPDLLFGGRAKWSAMKRLLHFGSWVTVSQVASPVLVYLDRMLLGSYVSLAAVTFYSVPYELMMRLRVVPSGLSSTLFPALSERASESSRGMHRLYSASLVCLVLLLVPVFTVLFFYGGDILSLWMGPAFSRQATIVLQIMVFGAFMNCLAYIPYSALQADGRPDLTGKFHLLEAVGHVILCFALIPRWGLVGAAIAGSARYVLDGLLLFTAIQKVSSIRIEPRLIRSIVLSVVLILGLASVHFGLVPIYSVPAGCVLLIGYGVLAWMTVLGAEDRTLIASILRLRMHAA